MIDFNKISINQIAYLSQVINESSLFQEEFVKAKYSRTMPNYQTTVEFLRTLNLIEIDDKATIIIKPRYKGLLQDIQKSEKPTEVVNKYLLKHIYDTRNEFREYANEFLSNFSFHGEHYEFKPTLKQKLQYSGIRNFLMQLHILDYDSTDVKYIIEDYFVVERLESNEEHLVSEKNFKKIQNMKEQIGRAAEEAVLEYEKARLSEFPHIVDKIKHIASKDVSAGYDIKSYEHHEDESFIPRLIEVKAVSSWDYHFYWTKNEIETSRLNGTNYYLYLLPIYTKNEFDLKNMKQIRDPFTNVYNNKNMWTPTIETISYALFNEPQVKEASDEA